MPSSDNCIHAAFLIPRAAQPWCIKMFFACFPLLFLFARLSPTFSRALFLLFRSTVGNPVRPHHAVNSNPRQIKLLNVVRVRGSVTVEALAETLGVTLQTVRRDVQRMSEAGLLSRFHGGVRVPSSTVENIAHQQRESLHAAAKAAIARTVAGQVPNDCSLIINI